MGFFDKRALKKYQKEAKQVLEHNKEERHIRGGMATKLKYKAKNS